jgi:hypothetical protein
MPAQETQHLYETILHSTSASAKGKLDDPVNLRGSANMQLSQPLGEMMQKLHVLEMIVEQTNAELRRLEGMIRQALDA